MDQSEQSLTVLAFLIPLILAVIPAACFFAGGKMSRKGVSSYVSGALYWFGGHGVTLVLAVLLTKAGAVVLPGIIIEQLPLIFTLVYLALGLMLRSPYFFTLGIATVGLWKFCTAFWQAFSGVPVLLYALPYDPFWYLLAAFVLFGLHFVPRPNELWEDAAASIVTLSGGYLMGGLMLLALGTPGLLLAIGLPVYIWGAALAALAAVLFWCSRVIMEPVLGIAALFGFVGGVYAFISRYPWS